MARISLIGQYDQYSVGLRIMSSLLRSKGHFCNIIFFKLPSLRALSHLTPLKDMTHCQLTDGELQVEGYISNELPWTNIEVERLIEQLNRNEPDIIGLSARSLHDQNNEKLLMEIKARVPHKVLIAGGFGPTFNPEPYLKNVDYVVFGEGEEAIVDLSSAIDSGKPLDEIDNLIHKRNGEIQFNSVRKPETILDKYPLPDYDNQDIYYIENNKLHKSDPATIYHTFHPILVGRGCVGKCAYCSSGQWRVLYSEHGHKIPTRRLRSVDKVIEELKSIKMRGYESVQFLDCFLTGPKTYLLELFSRYKTEIDMPFLADIHPFQAYNSPDLLDVLISAGLKYVTVPVQHGSESFRRKYLDRKFSNDFIFKVSELYHSKQIEIYYHLIAGFQYETKQSLNESIEFVSKLPTKNTHQYIQLLWLLPDTPLTNRIRRDGCDYIYDYEKWLTTVILYYLCTFLPPNLFLQIKENAFKIIFQKQGGKKWKNGIPEIFRILVELFKKERFSIPWHNPLLRTIYQSYLAEMNGSSVIVWGSLVQYEKFKNIFNSINIEAFIIDDQIFKKVSVQDSFVKPPSYLEGKNLPVFIFSESKKEIVKNIRKRYPNVSIIP